MMPILERAVRPQPKPGKPTRINRPAPFRPARRLTDLEARLLSASNALKAVKVEHLQ